MIIIQVVVICKLWIAIGAIPPFEKRLEMTLSRTEARQAVFAFMAALPATVAVFAGMLALAEFAV